MEISEEEIEPPETRIRCGWGYHHTSRKREEKLQMSNTMCHIKGTTYELDTYKGQKETPSAHENTPGQYMRSIANFNR